MTLDQEQRFYILTPLFWGVRISTFEFGQGYKHFSSVQSLSCIWLFVTPWTAARQASLSIINSQSLLKLMSIELVMSSNHLILYFPLLLLPSIFPSISVFSSESVLCIRWPKYWSFSFSTHPSNEYLGLISLRIDWLDLLAVQGTLKSLFQHHSSKASILWCSAFFMAQLSHPYISSVQFSCSVVSHSLQPHGLQHSRPPCPSPTNISIFLSYSLFCFFAFLTSCTE